MFPLPILVRSALVVMLAVLLGACSAESRKERSLGKAAEAYRAGDFEKARIEYQNVLQNFPNDPVANERLALIWFDRGAPVRALVYFSRLNLQTPANQALRLKRARALLALGRTGEARREAEGILRTTANVPEALLLLTETIRERDDFKAADEILQKFAEKNSASFHLASANLFLLRGDVPAVRTALQRALVLEPKSPEVHGAMARFHVSQQDAGQALTSFKTAAELAPLRSPVRLVYAGHLAQTGAVAEAIAMLEDLTKKAPDYFPAWRALAQIAMQQARFDDALNLLQNVLRQDGSEIDSLILRARTLMAKGDAKTAIAELTQFGSAVPGLGAEKHTLALALLQTQDQAGGTAALEQAVAQFPDNIDAVLLLAQLKLRAGKPQGVAEAMAALVNRRPDLIQAYLLLIEAAGAIGRLEPLAQSLAANLPTAPNKAQIHYFLGVVQLRLAKDAESRQNLEAALALAPDMLIASIELVNLDLKEGKTDAALARAQSIITKHPKAAVGHVLASRSHAAAKNWNAAEDSAIAAINLAPNEASAYWSLTAALSARLQEPRTLERLETLLAQRGDNALAVLAGGEIYTARKDYVKAKELYEKHLAKFPGASGILNNLAYLLADQLNQLDRGVELARKAHEIDPASAAIADTLGWLLHRKNDSRGALPLLQQAARGLPGNPEVNYHLGVVSLAVGDEANALAAFRIAASNGPDVPAKAEAKAKVAELEKKLPALPAPKQ